MFTCVNLKLIFCFFSEFLIGFFFRKGFLDPFMVQSRSSFLFSL